MPNEYDYMNQQNDEEYKGHPKDEEYNEYSDDEEYKWHPIIDEYKWHPIEDEWHPIEDEYKWHNEDDGDKYDPKPIAVELKEKVLCGAISVTNSITNNLSLSVSIPANAAITKIYASMRQRQETPLDVGEIVIKTKEKSIFDTEFSKNPFESVGAFETTFVQPLLVGAEGADVTLFSGRGNFAINAAALKLTVVYCPN